MIDVLGAVKLRGRGSISSEMTSRLVVLESPPNLVTPTFLLGLSGGVATG